MTIAFPLENDWTTKLGSPHSKRHMYNAPAFACSWYEVISTSINSREALIEGSESSNLFWPDVRSCRQHDIRCGMALPDGLDQPARSIECRTGHFVSGEPTPLQRDWGSAKQPVLASSNLVCTTPSFKSPNKVNG
ncbi:hypothetical protein HYFRA_00011306 [Hymenoscyphus fraxineus]|uniref:Uncharacterized protein n=1 Tax=Hymenoscyphus fraxineus TaxID=746836 RepID=A0A9N9KYY2_9HELO|nr:hypothetical protein HYFRA_00011306 [Hymenoscyphus fraxineus]